MKKSNQKKIIHETNENWKTTTQYFFTDFFILSFSVLFLTLPLDYTPLNIARGFGMRVVGGKTGADGRLFAYLVWTVPGGPAEKMGLQQGDKVSQHFLN